MEEKEKITGKNSKLIKNNYNNHNIMKTTQVTNSEQSIKTQTFKYKYVYSNTNTNNIKDIKENSFINNNSNLEKNNINNISYIRINSKNNTKKQLSPKNKLLRSPSPLYEKTNCETNYSINKISNVKYINGNDKKISDLNYIRKPDKKFINHDNNEQILYTKNKKYIMRGENEEKCRCDINDKCTCGKRRNIIKMNQDGVMMSINKENDYYLNNKSTISQNVNEKKNVKTKYVNYLTDNINRKKHIKKLERKNVETYPVFFSDEDINSKTKSKLMPNKKIIEYSSPSNYNYRNNRNIKISRYYNENFNTVDDNKNKRLENVKRSSYINIYTGNQKSPQKNNHTFKSICNFSQKKNNENRRNLNIHSEERSELNKSNESNRKYKYNISIHNINVKRGMNRSVSYESFRNTKRNISNVYSSEEYNKKYNIIKVPSYEKKDLKMQNAQNMQVIQEEKLFHILVPIPQNKIEYSCNLQFSGSGKKKYSLEEINEIRKRKMIKETEIINKKRKEFYNNLVNKEIIVTKKQILKKPNWNKTNKAINENKLNYNFNKKQKNQKEFDTENFEINIADNGRKFRGEMYIENNTIEYEKQEKDPNSNLLLSPNQEISLIAEYPRRDWNNISKPISCRPLSIEGKPKQVLLERSVEKMSIKGKKPKNNWNISNNERKEVNINLYQKKKRQNLSKERMQPFVIKGKAKNWNYTTKKENESNIMIKGIEKKKENEEEVLINDDYNVIEGNHLRSLQAVIKKVHENTDDSSSEYDVFKNLKNYGQMNDYKDIIIDSMKTAEEQENKRKIIINNITGVFPNGIELYKGKDNKLENIEINFQNTNSTISENYKNKITYNNILSPLKVSESNKIEFNTPKKETKIIYREIISNTQKEINNGPQKDLNNLKNIQNNDNNSRDIPNTDFNSPKSQTKYLYREEIVSLSPSNFDNQIDLLSNNFSNLSSNQIGNIDNQNDFFSKRNSNKSGYNNEINNFSNNKNKQEEIDNNYKNESEMHQNINQIKNQQNNFLIEESEQQVPKIQDDETQMTNNNNLNLSGQNHKKQNQIQYIYKKDNQNNEYFQLINQQKAVEEKYDSNNNNLKNNVIKKEKDKINSYNNYNNYINSNNSNNFNNNYNNYNNSNYNFSQQEQENVINQKEINQRTIIYKNGNKLQEGYDNRNQADEIEKKITNKSQIINENYLKNLNNINNQQQQNELSKSLELQSEAQSQILSQYNNKYNNLIKGYSKYMKNNPVDNYNNFSLNKLNIIPMTAGNYGNIILNNTLTSSKKYYENNRTNQNNMKNNNINNKSSEINISNYYSVGINLGNKPKKVKVLKP